MKTILSLGLFVFSVNALGQVSSGGSSSQRRTPHHHRVTRTLATTIAGSILAREVDPETWRDGVEARCLEAADTNSDTTCSPTHKCFQREQTCPLDSWEVSIVTDEKAYRCPDGSIQTSREGVTVDRMSRSYGDISYWAEVAVCQTDDTYPDEDEAEQEEQADDEVIVIGSSDHAESQERK
ncbi:MAG: hypothetical protein AB7T49_07765 [Oligoflexales bacterium]